MNSDRRKSILSNVEGLSDRFPVGMRVLAVDDSESCLKILEKLLKKCQYQVTTSTDAREALKLVRERKDKFDLVITDVFMPEIDGLRFLQLVGLEMDLPVIMLSGSGDIELVRKGIMNGACDYLLKPVRLEEIKNIWQHVLRRKARHHEKRSPKDDDDDDDDDNDEKLDKNIKEQQEEDKKDEEETEERKKTRVSWTAELNQKFMAAVNQLGPEKAVPKKILELMNQEGLTRENVASHLQKFRQNLKKNPAGMFGQKDILYSSLGGIGPHLNMYSLGGSTDFQALAASRDLLNCGLSSHPPRRMFSSELHTSANLRQNVILPSEPFQASQNMSNSINAPNKLLPSIYPSNQLPRIHQGNPTLMELSHLQPNGSINSRGSYDPIPNPATFGVPNNFLDSKPAIGSSNVSLPNVPSKPLMIQKGGGFEVQSSSYLDSDPQKKVITGSTSSELFDQSRLNGNWHGTTQLSKFSTNPLQVAGICSNMGGNNYSPIPQINNSQIASSYRSAISLPMHDTTGSMCSQTGFMGGIVDNIPLTGIQAWDYYTQDYTPTLNHDFDPSSYLVPTNDPFSSLNEAMGQNSSAYQMNIGSDTFCQLDEVKKLSEECIRSNESYVLLQTQEQMDFGSSSYGLLADLISSHKTGAGWLSES